jgi:hypothetical protein
VVSSPPATEETGACGREIESRHGIPRVVALTCIFTKHLIDLSTVISRKNCIKIFYNIVAFVAIFSA